MSSSTPHETKKAHLVRVNRWASTAGSVTRYSNNSLEHLSAALSRFATPDPDEKSLEQLEAIFKRIATSPRKHTQPVARIHDAARRLGTERVSELAAKYEAGSPAQALAEEFEVGISTVLRIVRSQGGAVRGHSVSDQIRDEACRLYESGLSVQKVADRLELTQSTTLRTLTRAGVAMRKRKNIPHA